MSEDRSPVVDGVFYGGAAYIFSYLWVYINVIRQGNVAEKVAKTSVGAKTIGAVNTSTKEAASLLVPSDWKYAGWLYHYSKGGSTSVTANFIPGSYPVNDSLMFPDTMGGNVSGVRDTILKDPLDLPGVVSIVTDLTNFEALTIVSVTPSALFVAGAILAYRNDETTPVGGAISGAKITAGFLLVSVIGVYLFSVSVSGFSFDASTGFSVGGSAGMEVIEGSVEASSEFGAELEPSLSMGPSLGRAVLSGFFFPIIFGSMGGVMGAKAGLVKVPGRWAKSLLKN